MNAYATMAYAKQKTMLSQPGSSLVASQCASLLVCNTCTSSLQGVLGTKMLARSAFLGSLEMTRFSMNSGAKQLWGFAQDACKILVKFSGVVPGDEAMDCWQVWFPDTSASQRFKAVVHNCKR